MHISQTSSNSLYNTNNFEAKNKQNQDAKTLGFSIEDSLSTRVTISREAQELANTSDNIKKYALPSWFEEFQPKIYILNNENSYQPNHIIEKQNYVNEFKSELKEYNKIFSLNYKETKAEHGINTQEDMYEKVIKNTNFSETIRQSLEEKMRGNPRAAILMGILGIGQV